MVGQHTHQQKKETNYCTKTLLIYNEEPCMMEPCPQPLSRRPMHALIASSPGNPVFEISRSGTVWLWSGIQMVPILLGKQSAIQGVPIFTKGYSLARGHKNGHFDALLSQENADPGSCILPVIWGPGSPFT